MQIHEIVHNATLEIISDTADNDLLTHIHDLEVSQVRLFAISVNGAVHLFVVANAVTEIEGGSLRVLSTVVRAGSLDVSDIGHDKLFVVTLALDKENLDAVFVADLQDPFTAFQSRIGSIKNTNNAARPEPGEHVGNSSLSGSTAGAFSFRIVDIEKVGRGLWCIIAAVVANVESLSRDGEPLKISLG